MHFNNAKLMASLATLATLGACMSGSGTGSMGGSTSAGTSTGTMNAPVAPTNTGQVAPAGAVDTSATRTPPTGAANSTNGTGTAVAGIGGGLSGAPSGAVAVPGNTITNIGSDARIVSAIDVVNTDEIAEGMLVRQRATLPQVRAYAEEMINDHTRLQGQDRALAANPAFISSDSADITREMRRKDNASMVRLRAMPNGADFDVAYIAGEVSGHKDALALLNAAKTQARDSRVSDLITAAIPVVQHHLDQAIAIQRTMGGSGM